MKFWNDLIETAQLRNLPPHKTPVKGTRTNILYLFRRFPWIPCIGIVSLARTTVIAGESCAPLCSAHSASLSVQSAYTTSQQVTVEW